jgi:hypothetical protein
MKLLNFIIPKSHKATFLPGHFLIQLSHKTWFGQMWHFATYIWLPSSFEFWLEIPAEMDTYIKSNCRSQAGSNGHAVGTMLPLGELFKKSLD